jgi:hypothetical protein
VGFGEYLWHYFLQAESFADILVPGQSRHSHNIGLQLLAETGIAGTVFIAAAVATWLWRRRRVVARTSDWWILGMLGVEGIHSMLEFPLWHANFLGPTALLFGIGETGWFTSRLGRSLRLAVAALILMGGLILIDTFRSYRDLEQWVLNSIRNRPGDAESLRGVQEALIRIDSTPVLVPYIELAFTDTITPDRNSLQEKLALNSQVLRFAAVWPVAYRQALLLALAGEKDAAQVQLRRTMLLYPNQVETFLKAVGPLASEDPDTFSGLVDVARNKLEKDKQRKENQGVR